MTAESEDPDMNVIRTNRPGIRKVLGDLEAEIMELIWERPPAGQGVMVRDIFEILYERRHLAYTTVMSTMSRLAKKKVLRVEKKDQAYIYSPFLTKQEFIARFVGRIVEDLLVNFSGEVLESLKAAPDARAAEVARKFFSEIEQRRQAGEKM
jgi:predicted transcriptional regulator